LGTTKMGRRPIEPTSNDPQMEDNHV